MCLWEQSLLHSLSQNRLGMEQRFLYKSCIVFCILMRPAISFLKSKNFQLFVKKKNQLIIPRSGYCTPFGVYTQIGTFLQPVINNRLHTTVVDWTLYNCMVIPDRASKSDPRPGHDYTLNFDPGSRFQVELWPRTRINPVHNWTVTRVIFQRGILTRLQTQIPFTRWIVTHEGVKIQQHAQQLNIQQPRRVIIQRKIHWILTRGRNSMEGSKIYLTLAIAEWTRVRSLHP